MISLTIATWNLWNHPQQQAERLEAAAAVLAELGPDIVALQEVAMAMPAFGDRSAAEVLASVCGYPHMLMAAYPDEPGEGLAIISRYPLARVIAPATCALRAAATVGPVRVGITNAHLEYARVGTRERQAVDVIAAIDTSRQQGQYEVLVGDFNASPESSVGRFLRGEQTLAGAETERWYDVAQLAAMKAGRYASPTLDFLANPRWQDARTIEVPLRCDWILVRDVYAARLAWPTPGMAGLIGTEPSGPANVVASDHYGVIAALEMPEPPG